MKRRGLLALVTNSFWVPLDAHRALVARDTRTNRQEFTRQEVETIHLSGLKADEMTEVSNLAKTGVQCAAGGAGALGGHHHHPRAQGNCGSLQHHHSPTD